MWLFSSRRARRTAPVRRPSAYRPRLEALEDRCVPSAGTLDPTFGSGGIVTTALSNGNDTAYGVLLQPNGDIISYGDAQTVQTVKRVSSTIDNFGLARYTPAGTLDSTFGSGGVVITGFPGYTIGNVNYSGSDYIE